jgi:drug/metabolite transporter (DMT)-like permease
MLLSVVVVPVAGLGSGELADLDLASFSGESIAAFAYLVTMGSIVAYTAYVWLLDRAPLSRVSTYAYVNPVVALALGWLVVDEVITGVTVLGAAIVLVSVSLIIRIEADPVTSSARPASGG